MFGLATFCLIIAVIFGFCSLWTWMTVFIILSLVAIVLDELKNEKY